MDINTSFLCFTTFGSWKSLILLIAYNIFSWMLGCIKDDQMLLYSD